MAGPPMKNPAKMSFRLGAGGAVARELSRRSRKGLNFLSGGSSRRGQISDFAEQSAPPTIPAPPSIAVVNAFGEVLGTGSDPWKAPRVPAVCPGGCKALCPCGSGLCVCVCVGEGSTWAAES